jgi:hypothetical protein
LVSGDEVYPTAEYRMHLAVELSRQNVECGTGGPFGATVFERIAVTRDVLCGEAALVLQEYVRRGRSTTPAG